MQQIYPRWSVGHHADVNQAPEEWVAAEVPGAVQLDWARAKGWDDHNYGDNWKDYAWMEGVFWTYRAVLDAVSLEGGQRLFFVSKGIDYAFRILLDGECLLAHEGMFSTVEVDLTGRVKVGSVLEVCIDPIPKAVETPADRLQASESCKPAVAYGWDWHPRLVPSGIWDITYLEVRESASLPELSPEVTVSDDLSAGSVALAMLLSGECEDCTLEAELLSASGDSVLSQTLELSDGIAWGELKLEHPELWWPHDHGRPNLYRLQVTLRDAEGRTLDVKERAVGFRRVRLVMNEGAWKEPIGFPKTRSTPPIQLEVNNRKIFAKGSNWVNPEIFVGTITRETYEPLLRMAVEGHMNLLRIWGGAIVNKQSFYDLCDEMGVMVWTEFPLACNPYPDKADYLEVLDQESESIIERIRPHASNVIWCGGNELFNSWSEMTDQSHALRLLNAQCYDLDRSTPFLATSPVMGMGHGHYCFLDESNGREVYEVFQSAQGTAYTEFGMPGPSDVDYLKSFIPEGDLFPPKYGTAWESHHALGAWGGLTDSWLGQPTIEHYFGRMESLEQLVEHGQWLQCEGYKAIYEEARRQQPHCSMALNWCYNEPWPSAANNSVINYPHHPKPAYYAIRDACRPIMLSAKIRKFVYEPGERFEAELWLLNDRYEVADADEVTMQLEIGGVVLEPIIWKQPSAGRSENRRGPVAACDLPAQLEGVLTVTVASAAHPERNSSYKLLVAAATTAKNQSRELNL